MLFHSPYYLPSLMVFVAIYWSVGPRLRQNILLGGLSVLVLALGAHASLLNVAVMAVVSYFLVSGIRRAKTPSQARRLAALGVGICVADVIFSRGQQFGILIGASFFNLVLIEWLLTARERGSSLSPGNTLLGLTAFYNFAGGPILGLREHVAALRGQGSVDRLSFSLAFHRIALGVAKKAGADMINDLVLRFGSDAMVQTPMTSWIYALNVTAWFYLEFSGYSDMAIGTAKLLGVELPENFNLPFLASSARDYWARSFMPLIQWFERRVYSPVRAHPRLSALSSPAKTVVAFLAALLAISIWLGPGSARVAWVLYQGLFFLLGVHLAARFPRSSSLGAKAVAIASTFLVMLVGRLLLCGGSAVEGFHLIGRLFLTTAPGGTTPTSHVFYLLLAVSAVVVPHLVDWARVTRVERADSSLVPDLLSFVWILFAVAFGLWGYPFDYDKLLF